MLTQKAMSGSGQGQVDTVSIQGQHKVGTVSIQGQHEAGTVSTQGQVSIIGSGSSIVQKSEITLAPQQEKIYIWFHNKGLIGYFNQGQIARETCISINTVKKCISKFEGLNIIEIFEYDPVTRYRKYELNSQTKVVLMQGHVPSIGSGSGIGRVDTNNSSNKLVSKFIIKLTNYIKNSDFWNNQGLSLKKCEGWIKEHYPENPEEIINQLRYAEFDPNQIKPRKPGKTEMHVFYGCLERGGLGKPAGFKFPEEIAVQNALRAKEDQEKALKELETIRETQKLNAEKLVFLKFLNDKRSVQNFVEKIKTHYKKPSTLLKKSITVFEKSGDISETLERYLMGEFNKDE